MGRAVIDDADIRGRDGEARCLGNGKGAVYIGDGIVPLFGRTGDADGVGAGGFARVARRCADDEVLLTRNDGACDFRGEGQGVFGAEDLGSIRSRDDDGGWGDLQAAGSAGDGVVCMGAANGVAQAAHIGERGGSGAPGLAVGAVFDDGAGRRRNPDPARKGRAVIDSAAGKSLQRQGRRADGEDTVLRFDAVVPLVRFGSDNHSIAANVLARRAGERVNRGEAVIRDTADGGGKGGILVTEDLAGVGGRDGDGPRRDADDRRGGDAAVVGIGSDDIDGELAHVGEGGRSLAPVLFARGAVLDESALGHARHGGDGMLCAVIDAGVAGGRKNHGASRGDDEVRLVKGDGVVPLQGIALGSEGVGADCFAYFAAELILHGEACIAVALENTRHVSLKGGIRLTVGLAAVARRHGDGGGRNGEGAFGSGGIIIWVRGAELIAELAHVGDGGSFGAPGFAAVRAVFEDGVPVIRDRAGLGGRGKGKAVIYLRGRERSEVQAAFEDGEGAGNKANFIVPLLRLTGGRDDVGAGIAARLSGKRIGDEALALAGLQAGDRGREGGLFRRAVGHGEIIRFDGDHSRGNRQAAGDDGGRVAGGNVVPLGIQDADRGVLCAAVIIGADVRAAGGHIARDRQHMASGEAGDRAGISRNLGAGAGDLFREGGA